MKTKRVSYKAVKVSVIKEYSFSGYLTVIPSSSNNFKKDEKGWCSIDKPVDAWLDSRMICIGGYDMETGNVVIQYGPTPDLMVLDTPYEDFVKEFNKI